MPFRFGGVGAAADGEAFALAKLVGDKPTGGTDGGLGIFVDVGEGVGVGGAPLGARPIVVTDVGAAVFPTGVVGFACSSFCGLPNIDGTTDGADGGSGDRVDLR